MKGNDLFVCLKENERKKNKDELLYLEIMNGKLHNFIKIRKQNSKSKNHFHHLIFNIPIPF